MPPRFRSALLIALAWAAPVAAQSSGALARVGETILPEERAYFLLFPGVAGDTLRLTPGSQGTVVVRGGTADSLVLSVEQVRVLNDVLRRYESLFADDAPDLNVAALSGLIRWRAPTQERPEVIVDRRDGRVEGYLLTADPGGLVLSDAPARGPVDAGALVWVPAEDVVRVQERGFRGTVDVRPGGDPERYRTEALPFLQAATGFLRGLPPDLLEWRRSRTGGAPSPERPRDARFDRTPLSRWDVGLGIHSGVVDAGTTVADPFGIGTTFPEEWVGFTTGGVVRVGHSLTPRVSVEAAGRVWVANTVRGAVVEGRRYAGASADLVGVYAVLPERLRRVSIEALGGVSAAQFRTRTRLAFSREGVSAEGDETFESVGRVRLGGRVGGRVGYRPVRGVSFALEAGWSVYPGVPEAELVLRDATTGVVLERVEARTVDLQLRGVDASVRFHFGG